MRGAQKLPFMSGQMADDGFLHLDPREVEVVDIHMPPRCRVFQPARNANGLSQNQNVLHDPQQRLSLDLGSARQRF